MNEKFIIASLAVSTTMVSLLGLVRTSSATALDITCNTTSDIPKVVARIEGSKNKQTEVLSFLTEYFSAEKAQQNCEAAANTLQTLYSEEDVNYLASDTIDELPVVCAVERRGIGCDSYGAEILFTLDRQVNPAIALYNMLGKDFKRSQLPDSRTVSRIYTDLDFDWLWPF